MEILLPLINRSRFRRRPWVVGLLAVVCAFLIVLSVIIFRSFEYDFKIQMAKNQVWEIDKACTQFYLAHKEEFPKSLDDLTIQYEDGTGPYLKRETIIDPWGKQFCYDPSGALHEGPIPIPDIYCNAPDGRRFGNWKK
jgi:hypothetical protein